jgi:hypothetical protein
MKEARSDIAIDCPECGAQGHARFGQSVIKDEIRWYISIKCPVAGHVEHDGLGGGPESLRAQLIEEKGFWSIRVTGDAKPQTMKIVKRAMDLTLAGALAYVEKFPILWVGTTADADWLIRMLELGGVDAERWEVRYTHKDPTADELPDKESALQLLKHHNIDLREVRLVSHFYDGSMGIFLRRDGELSYLVIEFDPEGAKLLAHAFFALGIPVRRDELDADAMQRVLGAE